MPCLARKNQESLTHSLLQRCGMDGKVSTPTTVNAARGDLDANTIHVQFGSVCNGTEEILLNMKLDFCGARLTDEAIALVFDVAIVR